MCQEARAERGHARIANRICIYVYEKISTSLSLLHKYTHNTHYYKHMPARLVVRVVDVDDLEAQHLGAEVPHLLLMI